jgi:hypothetical protein
MNGTLPGGAPGAIALYTYEEETRDSEGDTDTDYYNFTVVLHDIPAAAVKASDVYCQRRSGFRFMDSAEDVFRRMQRLELESEALDKRYEVFYGAQDDQVWMRRLFSPSFIVWLTEKTPEDFAFEFSAGSLCVNVKGHCDNAAELDALCLAAGEVAERLATEAAELPPTAVPARSRRPATATPSWRRSPRRRSAAPTERATTRRPVASSVPPGRPAR